MTLSQNAKQFFKEVRTVAKSLVQTANFFLNLSFVKGSKIVFFNEIFFYKIKKTLYG